MTEEANDNNDVVQRLHDDEEDPNEETTNDSHPTYPTKTIGKDGSNDGGPKKKRAIIAVAVCLVVVTAVGLGLGLGLTNKNDIAESNNKSSASTGDVGLEDVNTNRSGSSDDGGGDNVANDTTANSGDSLNNEDTAESIMEYDAVIIGAGWAGIRATETLLSKGVESVLVLEAENYIGGRAKSININNNNNNLDENENETGINDSDRVGDVTNVPYELGCEWLYNTGNDMEETLMEEGYLDLALENDKLTAIPLQTGVFYHQTRDESTGEITTSVLEDSEEWMEEIWGGFLQFRDYWWDDLEGESYADAIDQYIDKCRWTDDESLQFLNLVEDVMETEYTADSSQLSVHEVEFFPPGYTIRAHYTSIPGMGFGNIASKHAQPFEDVISLNSKVAEIHSSEGYDDDGEYTIVTYVKDGVSEKVKAKTVLVTASLGVLKAGNIDFVPTLPEWKQDAIDKMGFGIVNKCIMVWNDDEDHVWPRDKLWFLLTTPDDETSGRWTQFHNPSKFKGQPSLTAWVGGDEAIEAEKQSDDEILEHVMENLRSMFPTIREPDGVVVSRWGMEENVRGTYSFPVPGRDFYDDAANLSRRIGNIWFAGEATGNGWATTMGAWNTGEEQALNMAESLVDA
mmetsp:Transcript_30573/g.63996  ORF Transcript_30573/g.63996 Transcript_30573/m.63996 type:complete len:627 (-) Transcript_30573:89-1969(-)